MKNARPFLIAVLPALILAAVSCRTLAPEEKTFTMRKTDKLQSPALTLTPTYLRCEYHVDPLGIDVLRPRLSWIVESPQRGQKQTAYRVLVASDRTHLKPGKSDLWDSGKVDSDDTAPILYDGKPLTSMMRCYWKVRVWDKDGKASDWSEPALWTMGLLADSDWKAAWIGMDETGYDLAYSEHLAGAQWIWFPEGNPRQSAPVATRYFRRAITIPENRKVRSARCFITADNSFVLHVNGRKVGTGTNYQQMVNLDITRRLHSGKNLLAVAATNEGDVPNPAGLLAALHIEFAQGALKLFVTDAEWKVTDTPATGWNRLDFQDQSWAKAKELGRCGCSPWGEISTGELLLPPPRYLRKEFTLKKPVKRATIYATALGLYDLHVNGQRVGEDYFTPGWTDYDTRVYYQTYDVTKLLAKGNNGIGAILADGWYAGHVGWGRKRDHYGDKPRFRAQLHVEYRDGSREILATNRSWKASTGPLREADFLMGETYDARLEMPGWDAPGFDDSGWQRVNVTSRIGAKVEAYPGMTVRRFAEVPPKAVTEPKKGTYVFDLGTNFAGFARLKVTGERGTEIVLRFAERLNPDGTIYTENLRGARATDTYICRGGGQEEIWQPRFTFHGFQYVEVTGYPGKPKPEAITGIEVTTHAPVVGRFECSDAMANQLYCNICQTQRSNFIEVPTDCPQRDERLGWTGDAQIYVRTATWNNDVAAFFTKWLVDLEDAQMPDGGFSDVAPRKTHDGYGVAAWGDAGVICPWTLYEVYGDPAFLSRHYDAMKRWIAYCREHSEGLLRPASGYGDWLSIQADTPKDVLATAYFAYSTKLVAHAAEVLGNEEDALEYNRLFEQIREAFNKAYVAPDGRIHGDTQTVYVLALAFDLLPPEQQPLAVAHLIENIESRDGHLSTGFVGTKDLMGVLTRIGRSDVAYRLFHNTTFPSWGFSLQHGATSIWERWDGWTPEKGFQNPGMNSFAHYSFGAVGEWMFKTIGGMDTDGAGFKKILIRPRPGENLQWARVRYDSIRGPIETHWEQRRREFRLQAAIPANTTATVYIPTSKPDRVTEGGRPISRAEGVRFLGIENGAAVYHIESGRYQFRAPRG